MRACSVVLRVSRAPEAREPSNLFFTCVRTRIRACVYGVSMECVGCVRQKLYLIKKLLFEYFSIEIIELKILKYDLILENFMERLLYIS
jgi:hypothetical protein